MAEGTGNSAEAFEKLITDHEKHIFNIAYRMLGNTEDAKDASQEIAVKIYKNMDKCQNMQSVKGWITTIANNACIDFLRRRKRFNAVSLEAEIETEDGSVEMQLPSGDPSPEEAAVYRELRSDIAAALAKLPAPYRALVVMRDIYGYSYNDIALGTGLQLGTVKSRLSRARNNLRRLLVGKEQNN